MSENPVEPWRDDATTLDEMTHQFLRSRKRGTSGARRVARKDTILNYETELRLFSAFVAVTMYRDLRRSHIERFTDELDDRVESGELAPATRLKKLRVLRAFFRWVARDEECVRSGLQHFEKALPVISDTPGRTYIPSEDEVRKFFAAINTNSKRGYRDYAAFTLMLDTGMRVNEVCLLEMEKLDLRNRQLVVSDGGKTGFRLVPLPKRTSAILARWVKLRESLAPEHECVFVSSKNKRPCNRRTFADACLKYCAKAKVGHITPHTFRHAFCTYAMEQNGNPSKIMSITGHKSFATFRKYEHIRGQALREESDRISPANHVFGDWSAEK